MHKQINNYISELNKAFQKGNATEHTYRPALQRLLEEITKDLTITNEPKRIDCGAPDYIITKNDIPVGYIEAKDVGVDLNGKANKSQFDRYKQSLENLVITDYINFQLFNDGVMVGMIAIATLESGKISALPKNFDAFLSLIQDFCMYQGQTIKSAEKLAKMMAAKAKLLAEVIEKSLNEDENQESDDKSLQDQLNAFKNVLIHDITKKGFADIYAQTITYGMFAARLHDTTPDTFSRQEAAELIPKSNPFLRKLFQYVAGYDLDDRIKWIVDALAYIFNATDIEELLKNFGKPNRMQDPIIHFYETFLAEYDPALRKSRGVWYTPQPVVNFIVRAVDDILKTEFGLSNGLADNSMIELERSIDQSTDKRFSDNKKKEKRRYHKVQVLDPATGTGTFLAETIKLIHEKFQNQQGMWNSYVEQHLIPRLNGFEILMASYSMAHLKIDLLLKETGYKPTKDQRLRIYLTNSLEEYHPDTGNLFASWLSAEANEANHIKRDTPVMVVMGNPPYSINSSNKGKWITDLTVDYKKDLNERNIQPLSDDYIKFIRYGQYFIDKNGSGILAYISNNSFIDGIIHRQMRKNLLESFDKIYILDLHGNAKKKEVCPDGSPDQNVFDIMQGVSINIFVKTGKKKANELGQIYHYDLYGKRIEKYNFLNENSIKRVTWSSITIKRSNFLFLGKNGKIKEEYEIGFLVNIFFEKASSGIQSEFDDIAIHSSKEKAKRILNELSNLSLDVFSQQYKLENKLNKLKKAQRDINTNKARIYKIDYKIFDTKYCIYTGKVNGIMGRPRHELAKNMLNAENISICLLRSLVDSTIFSSIFISKHLVDKNLYGFQTYFFPLYLYLEKNNDLFEQTQQARTPNLNMEIVGQIADKLGLQFTPEKENIDNAFAPIDLLDYIYAVLHSPSYREKYKEFLKIDFPRVPYPEDQEQFWKLVELGSKLRQLHLLEDIQPQKGLAGFPISGSNEVEKPNFDSGKLWVNDVQYFENVPESVWNFYIGGYQPAQKWLKDRKSRILSFDDIEHYQKMIYAMKQTIVLMAEIDKTMIIV